MLIYFIKRTAIFVLVLGICFEATSFLYWHTLSVGKSYFEGYLQQLETAPLWYYDKQTGVFYPESGHDMTYLGPEFADITRALQVPGTGISLFDDGLNPLSKHKFIGIGDSMTTGFGSIDHDKNNWVEYVERKLNKLDFINASYDASATESQLVYYKKIYKYIPHDTLVLNFYTGNDFTVYDMSERISGGDYLPENINKNDWVKNVQLARSYIVGYEEMKGAFFSYRVLTRLVYLLSRLVPNTGLAKHFPPCDPNLAAPPGQNNPKLQKYYDMMTGMIQRMMEAQRTEAKDHILQMKEPTIHVLQKGLFYYFNKTDYDKDYSNIMAADAAKKINEFHRFVKAQSKKFILIIHPKKSEVHFNSNIKQRPLYFYKGLGVIEKAKIPALNIDYTRLKLRKYLNQDIAVLDLTEGLREIANREQGQFLYWRFDSHYNPYGYMMVGELVCKYIQKSLGIIEQEQRCEPNKIDQLKLAKLREENNNFFSIKWSERIRQSIKKIF